jgi:hypothetical protein
MRSSCSIVSVPAATAATANRPYGLSRTTPRVAREMTTLAVWRISSKAAFRSTPMSATPTITEKSTTAGTMLLASAWKGFDGM